MLGPNDQPPLPHCRPSNAACPDLTVLFTTDEVLTRQDAPLEPFKPDSTSESASQPASLALPPTHLPTDRQTDRQLPDGPPSTPQHTTTTQPSSATRRAGMRLLLGVVLASYGVMRVVWWCVGTEILTRYKIWFESSASALLRDIRTFSYDMGPGKKRMKCCQTFSSFTPAVLAFLLETHAEDGGLCRPRLSPFVLEALRLEGKAGLQGEQLALELWSMMCYDRFAKYKVYLHEQAYLLRTRTRDVKVRRQAGRQGWRWRQPEGRSLIGRPLLHACPVVVCSWRCRW